ncbi:MAG TPA: glycosyltransferase [Ignavibacteriaceae bacterium]|nr:glycosyltransferase [Ignavibacteriaceae bacterium]
MDLSIIIVNYNVKEFIQNLLHSIQQASKNLKVEVIIVDNASDDGSIELISEKFPWVKLIINKENLGFSKANNIGLKIAAGKYLLLLNPDTLVQEDTFEKMISFFESNSKVGMAGCKILNPDGTLQLACRRSFPGPWTSFCKVSGLSSLFPKSRLFARYNLTYLDENQTYEVDAISGSFMMVNREVYEKIGGLDEIFFMYGEDLDWCYRVQKAGYKVYYFHGTQIIHYKGESTKRSSLDETKIFYDAMHLFVKKHLASSFLVELILRSAIGLRKFISFVGRRRLVFISVLSDFIFFNISLAIAEQIYEKFGDWKGFPDFSLPIIYTIPAIVQILTSSFIGVYRKDHIGVLKNIGAIVAGFFILSSVTYFFKDFAYSRGVVIVLYATLIFALSLWRIILKMFFRLGVPEIEFSSAKALIVGSNKSAIEIANRLKTKAASIYSFIGLIGQSRKEINRDVNGFKVVGSIENINKVIDEFKINEVIFSTDELSYNKMMEIVSQCQNQNVEFKLVGGDFDFLVGKSSVNLLNEVPLIGITYNISQPMNKFQKKIADVVISLIASIVFFPIILFRKRPNKTETISDLIKQVTDVLSGEKSLVGPKVSDVSSKLYLGKPGITGLWFTEGDYEENNEKIDIFYAKNQNIWLDLEIIGKTISRLLIKRK